MTENGKHRDEQGFPFMVDDSILREVIARRLNHLFSEELDTKNSPIEVEITSPSEETVSQYTRMNRTVSARLGIKWAGSRQALSLSFPYPFHGVFVFFSEQSLDQAGAWCWHPRLVGRPGIWLLRKHKYLKGKKKLLVSWVAVFPEGAQYVLRQKNIPYEQIAQLACQYDLYEFTSNISEVSVEAINYFQLLKDSTFAAGANKAELYRYLVKHPLDEVLLPFQDDDDLTEQQGIMDEQDISWQRLLTYQTFLLEKITSLFVRKKLSLLFSERALDNINDPANLWHSLSEFDGRELVPVSARSALMQQGYFHRFDPINALEAMSQLTAFQRYNFRRDVLDRLPAVYRQNHPSFRGIVCPVDSPESKMVGLTLHLAQGTRIDEFGRLSATSEEIPDSGLGFGASLVPFYQHNDGPRAMMGAKNLKQAVPVKGSVEPLIGTGNEKVAVQLLEPLVRCGFFHGSDTSVPGTDLLVAYIPWYGWNIEDALVVNRRLVDEEIMDWCTEETYSIYIKPEYVLVEPKFANTFEEAFKALRYEKGGLHRINSQVSPDTPIAFFRNCRTGEVHEIFCKGKESGELIDISFHQPLASFLGGSLTWKVRRTLPLRVGDKLMGRYGNKGIVSKILPGSEMPRLPDDVRLPVHLRGRSIDVLMNPHGVISRMNLGQLLETQIGLLAHLFPGQITGLASLGKAFQKIDYGQIRAFFEKLGSGQEEGVFDSFGRVRLRLPDGSFTLAPVTVGFQHVVRLRHVAGNKAQARGQGSRNSSYPVNLITGQPVGGRRRGGGQRLGEMELWALSANQAVNMMHEALTFKSDPSLYHRANKPSQTFNAIRDHLFASGVELANDETGGSRLQWINAKDLGKSAKEVSHGEMWILGQEAYWSCPNEQCSYRYPRPVMSTGRMQRHSRPTLTIRDALSARGWSVDISADQEVPAYSGQGKSEISGTITLQVSRDNQAKNKKKIIVSYKRGARSVHLQFKVSGEHVYAYRQVERNHVVPKEAVLSTPLTCPKHTTTRLKGHTHRQVAIAQQGGLCDPMMFGNLDVIDWQKGGGGFLRLPGDAFAHLEPALVKKHLLLNALHQQAQDNEFCLLPILPLRYRYQRPEVERGRITKQYDQFSRLYSRLYQLSNQKDKNHELVKTVANLSELLAERLFRKYGLIRRDGLGRRVDLSGRLVIVPDPELGWDDCGVPTETLMVLLGPAIAEDPSILVEYESYYTDAQQIIDTLFGAFCSGKPGDSRSEIEALNRVFWQGGLWPDRKRTEQHLQLAYGVISFYLDKHPEIKILLNRQPSLHRYSMMGFRPIPLPPEDGLVLKINPLVCKGFGADFDGDEMAIYLPTTPHAQAEIEGMQPSKQHNLVSVANGEPLANFDQDMVSGHLYLSIDARKRKAFSLLFSPECESCQEYLAQKAPWDKEHGTRLLTHVCRDHPEETKKIVRRWQELTLTSVTEGGLSFGCLELADMQSHIAQKIDQEQGAQKSREWREKTRLASDLVIQFLQRIMQKDIATAGFGLAAMAMSGARGRAQTRQLIGARGYLDPGDVGFLVAESIQGQVTAGIESALPYHAFFIPQPLVTGMTPDTAYLAAMNGRSSMVDKKLSTGRSGYLTRRLVLVLWDWVVRSGDCGYEGSDRSLHRCDWRYKRRICSACYGTFAGFTEVPDYFPAGLLAAQSFGERGTQLSMQSFHTAERQLSIDDVVALFAGKDPEGGNWFDAPDKVHGFVERIRREKAYGKIDERHLQLIWLVIYQSTGVNLGQAWKNTRTPLSGLLGPHQQEALLEAIESKAEEFGDSMVSKILTNTVSSTVADEVNHASQ